MSFSPAQGSGGGGGAATGLKSATTTVDTSAATAPTANQVLTATDSTHATWRAPGGVWTRTSTTLTPTTSGDNVSAPGVGTVSEKWGAGASAAGLYGQAFGYGATASGTSYANAFGLNATASGDNSTALGNATAAGDNSIAAGGSASSPMQSSTAFGASAQANGIYSTAIGGSSLTSNYSTAIGYFSRTGSVTNRFVCGSSIATASEIYFGDGPNGSADYSFFGTTGVSGSKSVTIQSGGNACMLSKSLMLGTATAGTNGSGTFAFTIDRRTGVGGYAAAGDALSIAVDHNYRSISCWDASGPYIVLEIGGVCMGASINTEDSGFWRLAAHSFSLGTATAGDTTGLLQCASLGLGVAAGVSGSLTATSVILSGKATTYNNVATAGYGVPAIYATANITAQSAAATITSYVNPATDGTFLISASVNVSAATSLSAPIQVTYTDASNAARTLNLPVQDPAGTAGTYLANGLMVAAAAKDFTTPVHQIRVKASTTITVKVGTGTFTGVTYSASALISQAA